MQQNNGIRWNQAVLISFALFAGCAPAELAPIDEQDELAECEGKCDGALVGRTTAEFCDAVDARWGDDWELEDTGGTKQSHVTDAMACANRRFWLTRYRPFAVHHKFYLHRQICESNPASHYAMEEDQRRFYCSISLHLRMCNTQGLYALRDIPDSLPRREREDEIFSACLELSGELEHFRTALRMDGRSDEDVASVVSALYHEYKVEPGVRVAPAIVNPDRASRSLFERLTRISYYGLTVPLELLESSFSNTFLSLDPSERESQIELILYYRASLENWHGQDLLDMQGMPICGNGELEPGEECDDANTTSGDGCASYCLIE
jgi:cysteine-rich repeat protein